MGKIKSHNRRHRTKKKPHEFLPTILSQDPYWAEPARKRDLLLKDRGPTLLSLLYGLMGSRKRFTEWSGKLKQRARRHGYVKLERGRDNWRGRNYHIVSLTEKGRDYVMKRLDKATEHLKRDFTW